MPDRELVLREKCGHGAVSRPCVCVCPGGSETVLDPERVVFRAWDSHNRQYSITVRDVLDALGGSDDPEEEEADAKGYPEEAPDPDDTESWPVARRH